MPELPEVETVRSDLERFTKGKKITTVEIKPDFAKKISPSREKFIDLVTGKSVKDITRRGKLLIFNLGKDMKVLAHLKMTGQFVWKGADGKLSHGGHPIEQKDTPDKYNKVLFTFGKHGKLYYNDIRKFGYFKLVDDATKDLELLKYGIEPIEEGFTFEKFDEILNRKPNLDIKKVLLMQDLIAGVGNIYVDESCFASGILPTRKIKTLKSKERKKLHKELVRIIKKAIKYRGSSVNTYVDGLGSRGSYAQFLNVYHRAGELCYQCGKAKIEKTKVAGRGTSYCPVCQI